MFHLGFRPRQLDNATWDNLGNPTQDPTSFNTQPAYVVQYTPAHGAPYYVYLADDWVHCGPAGLPDACYTWLPIQLDDASRSPLPVRIDWRASWDLDDPFGHRAR